MVVHKEREMMPRPHVDYSVRSTFMSSSASDREKIKTHTAVKERNKGRVGENHKHQKPRDGHGEKHESRRTCRTKEGGKSMPVWSSSSSLRKSAKSDVDAKVDFKEPQIPMRTTRGGGQVELVSKRHSSTSESDLSPKKTKRFDTETSHPDNQERVPPKINTNNLKSYTEELEDLHRRLMAIRERNTLQEIVNLIEETGLFNITKTTFDFDLFSLDKSTVRKLQRYLQAKTS